MLQERVPDLSKYVEPDRVRREVYTDPEIFAREMERIHERVWIYCGHESQVPKPGGPPHYYFATNQAELEQTFTDIAGGIIVPSCSFALEELPPDPDLVTVTLNGTAVPRDAGHQNGWDYHPDAGTITFFGGFCEMIEAGASSSVGFSYGCPGPVVD